MLTLMTVLVVRILLLVAALVALAGVALVARRWLRRTGRWDRVCVAVRSTVGSTGRGATPWRRAAGWVLDRWLDDGVRR